MAAKRLIIVLLVLFGISVAAAAIAPDRQGGLIGADSNSTSSSSTSTTSTSPAPATPTGETLTARIDASSSRPETVEGFVGDQLELHVASRGNGRVIEIGEFGLTDFAAPEAPATFDLLLREPGRFPITDGDSGRILGRLAVRKPAGHHGGKRGEPDHDRDQGQNHDRSGQTT